MIADNNGMEKDFFDLSSIKTLLSGAGITPKKLASQNFLICEEPITETVRHLGEGPRFITELGAGLGALTQAMLKKGFFVRAIEKDKEISALLRKILPVAQQMRLTLIEDDLRKAAWEWEKPYQLVGNIPYHLSGTILRRITQLRPAPTTVILLLQKEVGERIVATTPDMEFLGLVMQLWGVPTILDIVPASCFWPEPKVESCLLKITPHKNAGDTFGEREEIIRTAKLFFQQRRKQLLGTLKRSLHVSNEIASAILKECGLAAALRPQELTVGNWRDLTAALSGQKHVRL